jgi:hypothetical protein
MTQPTYQEILENARQLPVQSQVELVETLWHTLRNVQTPIVPKANLLPLFGLTDDELTALAEAIVAPEQQKKIRQHLRKVRRINRPVLVQLRRYRIELGLPPPVI